ncbi:MAG: glycosyltransferase family 39 protein, partial [Burkholderiales bacterium]|nr:glycosyltransferase family 39 protein [Anaerolineae bacterium]
MHRNARYALIAALMLIALAARIIPTPRTIDDAFITFRYSRNIVEGEGFVYNPGVHTLGTTTPLYTVLMAAISAVTGAQDFQWYALIVNALADAGTVALLYLLMRRLTGSDWVGVIPAVLWAVSPMSVTFAVGGMETSVTILWMVAATWCYVDKRDVWLGVFAALGLLTRIDAALWVGPLLAFQLFERLWSNRAESLLKRIPYRTWATAALVLLPWVVFSVGYFGTPLPNSLAAKSLAYRLPSESALVRMIQTYSNPFFEFDTFGALGAMLGSVIYLALSLMAMLYTARRQPRLLPFLLYPWLYLLAFAVLNPLIFRWYMAPPLPALMFGIVIGVWALIERLRERERLRVIVPVVMGAAGAVWLFTSLNAWTLTHDHGPQRPAPKMAFHLIELYYQQIAEQLRDDYGVTPETRVASGDIGAVGYFSRATIIDTVGLVTPELSRYYPIPSELIVDGQNYAIPP